MTMNKPSLPLLASALTTSLIGILLFWHIVKRRRVYVSVGKVKKLYVYPVKSMKGVEVQEIQCRDIGVEANGLMDRTFMLVSGENILVSLREEPSLVHLTPSIVGSELRIDGPDGMEPLKVPIKKKISPSDKVVLCRIHTDDIEAIDCGDRVAEWFQKYLNRSDVHLVQFSSELGKRKYAGNDPESVMGQRTHPASFQDYSAVHLVLQSSVEELNNRLEKPVSEMNFRPNILVEGPPAFSEDEWQFMKFSRSDVELATLFPCSRCVTTTVDPSTGEKINKEPLVALRKFRIPKDPKVAKLLNYAPCFGLVCRVEKPGSVHVGDEILVVVKKGLFTFAVKE